MQWAREVAYDGMAVGAPALDERAQQAHPARNIVRRQALKVEPAAGQAIHAGPARTGRVRPRPPARLAVRVGVGVGVVGPLKVDDLAQRAANVQGDPMHMVVLARRARTTGTTTEGERIGRGPRPE